MDNTGTIPGTIPGTPHRERIECRCELCRRCTDCGWTKYHSLECPQREDEGGARS